MPGIVWWCPTHPRARRRSSCEKETWCSSIRRGRTAGTKAPCRGRDRRACFPAASSRASELEKVDRMAHTVPDSESQNTHTHSYIHQDGWILVSHNYTHTHTLTYRKASLDFDQPHREQGSFSQTASRSEGLQRTRSVNYWNHTDSKSTERQTLPPSSPPWHHPPANTSTKSISSAFHWDLRTWIRVLSLFEKERFITGWWGKCSSLQLQDHCKHISVSSLWQQAHVFLINTIYVNNNACSIIMFFYIYVGIDVCVVPN